jgi:hypothetical protein
MFGREESISIEAAPEAVFCYVADIRRHAEWAAQALNIIVERGPEHGPGTTFSSTVRIGRGRIIAHGRIITEEAPVRFIYECRDLWGHYRWSMILQAEGTGTRLTQGMERLQAPLWVCLIQANFLWPLLGRPSVRNGLANIKARLEASKLAGESDVEGR